MKKVKAGSVLLVIGLSFLALAWREAERVSAFERTAVAVKGRVVKMKMEEEYTYLPVVRIEMWA